MNRRKRRLATGAAVLGAGALLAVPITAFAQQDDDDTTTTTPTEAEDTPRGSWITEALDGLVTDGTLTQAQADAVAEALQAAKPERPFGGGRHGPGGLGFGRIGLDAAAEVIGIEEDDLRDALRDGTTLAELATQNGVEVQAVIDALVAEGNERIDERRRGRPDRRGRGRRATHRAHRAHHHPRQRRLPHPRRPPTTRRRDRPTTPPRRPPPADPTECLLHAVSDVRLHACASLITARVAIEAMTASIVAPKWSTSCDL